jgi:hypothetical protein
VFRRLEGSEEGFDLSPREAPLMMMFKAERELMSILMKKEDKEVICSIGGGACLTWGRPL